MVPAVGIEPTRTQGPRDFECENAIFSNPLILARFSRNRPKRMRIFISIYSSLFYLFRSFWLFFSTNLAQSASGFQPEGLYSTARIFPFRDPDGLSPPPLPHFPSASRANASPAFINAFGLCAAKNEAECLETGGVKIQARRK
jgi:hypothetical protein